VDKTPTTARLLIENKISNNQQFNTKSNFVNLVRGVHEITNEHSKLKSKLDDLVSMVKQPVMSQTTTKVCGICTSNTHYIDSCPTL